MQQDPLYLRATGLQPVQPVRDTLLKVQLPAHKILRDTIPPDRRDHLHKVCPVRLVCLDRSSLFICRAPSISGYITAT
jgi:hypothetical protein